MKLNKLSASKGYVIHRTIFAVSVAAAFIATPVCAQDKSPATTNAEVITMPKTPATTWVENGQSKYVIVTADEPFPIAAYAAQELAHHLELATGAKLPIIAESKLAPNQTARIYVGQTKAAAAAKIDADKLANEVCVLKTVGDDLFIVGHDGPGHALDFDNVHSGTLWGVYEVLERLVNARWLWPGEGGIAVDKKKNVSASMFDETIKPFLETRLIATYVPWNNGDPVIYDAFLYGYNSGLSYSSVEVFKKYLVDQQAFLRRQRMGTSRAPSDNVGHDFIGWWAAYGKTHPEWFQLLPEAKGRFVGLSQEDRAHFAHGMPQDSFAHKRGPDNPADPYSFAMCVSDEGLQNEIIRLWQEARKTNPAAEIRVGENDIWGQCVCDDCVALDGPQLSDEEKKKLPGSVGGSNFPFNSGRRYAIFYQRLYEKAKKIDPEARVLGYAYLNYITAPTDVKLDPHITLNFVPWGGYWYPRDPREQQWLREQWLQWRKLGANLFFRPNYVLNGGSMPDNYMHQSLDQFDFYLHNGCTGTSFDARPGQWSAQGATMYSLLRKHTHPDASTEQILDEYYSAFGPGAYFVKAYFDFWESNSNSNAALRGDVWGKYGASNLLTYARVARDLYPPEAFARAGQFLDMAQKAIEAQPGERQAEYLERVQYLRLGMEHAQKVAAVSGVFADKDSTLEARRAAFKDLRDFRFATETKAVANYALSVADEMRSFGDRYDFGAKIEVDVRPAD